MIFICGTWFIQKICYSHQDRGTLHNGCGEVGERRCPSALEKSVIDRDKSSSGHHGAPVSWNHLYLCCPLRKMHMKKMPVSFAPDHHESCISFTHPC